MTFLSAAIEDSLDDAMEPYTSSEEYAEEQSRIDDALQHFRNTLSQSQQKEFNDLQDLITASHAAFASEAYVIGVTCGIAHGKEFLR